MEKVTDLDFIRHFTGGDSDKIQRLIHIFLETAPMNLQRLEEAKNNADWNEVKTVVHLLKANSQYLGMKTLLPLIEIIELYIVSNENIELLPSLIEDVKIICNKAIAELEVEFPL